MSRLTEPIVAEIGSIPPFSRQISIAVLGSAAVATADDQDRPLANLMPRLLMPKPGISLVGGGSHTASRSNMHRQTPKNRRLAGFEWDIELIGRGVDPSHMTTPNYVIYRNIIIETMAGSAQSHIQKIARSRSTARDPGLRRDWQALAGNRSDWPMNRRELAPVGRCEHMQARLPQGEPCDAEPA